MPPGSAAIALPNAKVTTVAAEAKIQIITTAKNSTVKMLCDILGLTDADAIRKYYGEEYKEYRYLRLPGVCST